MGINRIFKQIFLLLTGILLMACSASDETPSPIHRYTLKVEATKGSEETMRTLTDDGSSLTASWLTTENIYVKKGGAWCSGSLQPQSDGVTAKLSGDITGQIINIDDDLTLQFPRQAIDYTGQLGTLADIAANFDYATATATVTSVSGSQISADAVTFTNQQAIVKFTLTDGTDALPVTSLTISTAGLKTTDTTTGDITITPASATNEIWAALSGVNGKITLTAISGGKTYTYTTAATKTFANGKYYAITVKMKNAMLSQPLTLEAIEDGNISFFNKSNGTVYFKRNDGDWIELTEATIYSVNAGTKISFYGTGISYSPGSEDSYISCTSQCYVYGNIMSLLGLEGFSTNTILTADDTFRALFKGNTNIRNHPNKDLLLPATTLKSNCYSHMFEGCTGLERAPVLPASTLKANCYESMFSGCSNLSYIKCLATNITATECLNNWVEGVKSSGTFVKASGMTDWETGSNGIPSGWTIQK